MEFKILKKLKMPLLKIKKSQSAFSLIEVAIVLVVISILIIGSIKGSELIQKSKISKAQSLTQLSPVKDLKDLTLWLESVSSFSFNKAEAEDYNGLTATEQNYGKGSISKWYDLSPKNVTRRNATNTTLSSRPKYYFDCINRVPCLYFSGSQFLDISNLISHSLSDYTIFIVDARSESSLMPILGSDSNGLLNKSIEIGYLNSNTIYWSQGDSSQQKEFHSEVLANNNTNLHLFINATNKSSNSNIQYYLNGLSLTTSNPGVTVNFSNTNLSSILQIGKSGSSFYKGFIGEVIIIPYAISKNERIAITHYLKKKWDIK